MAWLVVLFVSMLQADLATIVCHVTALGIPVSEADIVIGGKTYRTAATGEVRVPVESGSVDINVVKEGFVTVTTRVTAAAGQVQVVDIELQPQPTVEEQITVSATRTGKRLNDQPMRVEVLDKEDLEEEQAQTPGDVVMVLSEKAGIRVQTTAPGLGAATIRIQGLRGRYTRVLSDGLPLFGEDVQGLGLLQVPPADLGQIEVIKGVASALYGAGALAGVIDLISRRPEAKPNRHALVNRSTQGATDAVLFTGDSFNDRWSGTLLVGGHWQQQHDVDGDGWADVAGYSRGIARPRVFWDDKKGDSVFATAGVMWEQRTGGTLSSAMLPTTGAPFVEALQTTRWDAGVVGQTLVSGRYVLTARGSVTHQYHDHLFGDVREIDRDDTLFGEIALRGTAGLHTWVVGGAFERHTFDPQDVPRFAYQYRVPAVFAQDDVAARPWLNISASARVDVHNMFGTFVSPRVSGLVRNGGWSVRASIGTGFFAPTPVTEETQAAGLTRLIIPIPLEPERGRSASVDLTRAVGPLSVTASAFDSTIRDPVVLDRDHYALRNLGVATTNVGGELLAAWHQEPFSLTTTYTYVHSNEGVGAGRGDVPLTPRHSVGVFGSWDEDEWGRVTIEWFYTGRQRLEDNPYRNQSEPYRLFGVLVERRLRHLNLFINGENLGNVRQTRWDPLIRPTPAADGQWTVDAWAPLNGRVINGGVRVAF